MVLFAAATGLRPGEWIALEPRDVDHEARVVDVRRAFTDGRLGAPKTRRSLRGVPLQRVALQAPSSCRAARFRDLLEEAGTDVAAAVEDYLRAERNPPPEP
jgi:integrase